MAERADELADRVRACFKYDRGDHHQRCTTKQDEGCDCYARRAVDGHLALDALLAELEAARGLYVAGMGLARQPVDFNYVAIPAQLWEDLGVALAVSGGGSDG